LLKEVQVVSHQWCDRNIKCPWTKSEMMDLFEIIYKIPSVCKIHGVCKEISAVEPRVLAAVVNRLEEWSFPDYHNLSPEHMELLFSAMAKQTHLKKLDSGYSCFGGLTQFSTISPAVFAAAVSNVADVSFDWCYISTLQTEALFEAITVEDRSLRTLAFQYTEMIYPIDPETVGRALNRLEELTIQDDGFRGQTRIYSSAIMRNLVEGESRLKILRLDPMYLRNLDEDLVRRAREKLGAGFHCEEYEEEYDSEDNFSEEIYDADEEEAEDENRGEEEGEDG